jgi:uncharacterized repeat protein (TIGR03803 family)
MSVTSCRTIAGGSPAVLAKLRLAALLFLAAASPAYGELAFQVLYKFFPTPQYLLYPSGRLAEGRDGNFYGTTAGGANPGNVPFYDQFYRISPGGSLTNLTLFDHAEAFATKGLLALDDGFFYGVAQMNGEGTAGPFDGSIYKADTNGIITILFYFSSTNGSAPAGQLTKGVDQHLYGFTQWGGEQDLGTIYEITTNGVLTLLHSFAGTNGCNPFFGSLVRDTNGNFYGITPYGGVGFAGQFTGLGTVFKLTTNGIFTPLVYFNGTNGSSPWSGLSPASDQSFYGITRLGGAYGLGTIFRMTAEGSLTTLLSFNGTNGARPTGDIAQGSDGKFYGLSSARLDGTNWTFGTLFSFNTNGVLNTLVNFDGTNGRNSYATLTPGSDGNLYGTMLDEMKKANADGSIGSVFRLVQPPIISSILRSNDTITLTWTSFTNGIYRLEYKPNITAPDWAPISSNITAAATSSTFTMPLDAVSQRYWRVVLLP